MNKNVCIYISMKRKFYGTNNDFRWFQMNMYNKCKIFNKTKQKVYAYILVKVQKKQQRTAKRRAVTINKKYKYSYYKEQRKRSEQ